MLALLIVGFQRYFVFQFLFLLILLHPHTHTKTNLQQWTPWIKVPQRERWGEQRNNDNQVCTWGVHNKTKTEEKQKGTPWFPTFWGLSYLPNKNRKKTFFILENSTSYSFLLFFENATRSPSLLVLSLNRDLDPRSHSRSLSLLRTALRAWNCIAGRVQLFLPFYIRVELCLPTP